MSARQDSDNLAWDQSDELWEKTMKQVRLSSVCRKIEAFAEKIFANPGPMITPLIIGGFNVLYPFRVEGRNVLIRMPCPNQALFPEEKTLSEAATAAFISQHTQVPVPKLLNHGVDPDIGPFMVIEDLGTRRCMSDVLETPREDPNDVPVLNPDIPETKLRSVYLAVARLVLQLAQPSFPRIGSLLESAGTFDVAARPVTLNMSNMVQLANIPRSILPSKDTTYHIADEWYTALADMHIATLLFQHNDMISSEDDCRTKYVARQLFRRLAKQGRLSTFGFAEDNWSALASAHQNEASEARLPAPDGAGAFRLWSDDFRPVNILVNEQDTIVGAIDWEFAYVAPTQFALDPPWWLLLDVPEMWDDGIDDWTKVYEGRLETWLSAMEEAEQDPALGPDFLLLSAYMRESWSTGRFWLNYAARKSWAFDTIYWKYLDERFFGKREEGVPADELWKTRVELLREDERAAMESMMQIKMEESTKRVLVEWEADDARKRLSAFLFD
ncbi:hypothetical protein NEMBOFW57_008180 [Staphylotrichum longicolle]|uniref:Aminoglycoside phosphotransferase domain-containing protein n=1 Tax=Staphylotrichum longicolle TaxID=669026 RepID=A0AAD4HWE1_9PEZI|nr:hypothetical protein NEMBOFW57_008180 [Staphylotrichum longicolle]